MASMRVIAIDPGPTQSALVVWDDYQEKLGQVWYKDNNEIVAILKSWRTLEKNCTLVIEKMQSFGMAVGAEVFNTCIWIGRFMEAYGADNTSLITRIEVKMHHCHTAKAKDGNVRQAIIDRFGGKEKAIGKKHSPGPLHGISGDKWSALAIALTYWDTHQGKQPRRKRA